MSKMLIELEWDGEECGVCSVREVKTGEARFPMLSSIFKAKSNVVDNLSNEQLAAAVIKAWAIVTTTTHKDKSPDEVSWSDVYDSLTKTKKEA